MDFNPDELRLVCCALAKREEFLLVREIDILALLGDPKFSADQVKNTTLLTLVRQMTLQTRLLKSRFELELPHELDSRGIPAPV